MGVEDADEHRQADAAVLVHQGLHLAVHLLALGLVAFAARGDQELVEFSFFQALSFQVESDLKNSVNSTSALGRGLMLPMVSGCFIHTFDQ